MKLIVSNLEAHFRIKEEKPFATSFITTEDGSKIRRWSGGEWAHHFPLATPLGHLPEQFHDDVRAARYVVWSYGTPIGWIRQDGTPVVPDIGYSDTTGQHQYTLRYGWGAGSFPSRGRVLRPAGGGPRQGGWDDHA